MTDKPSIYPALRYADAAAAADWLEHAFGFETIATHRGENGQVAHTELRFGNGVIMLGSARPDAFGTSPQQLGGVTGSIYTYVEDVDAHAERARAAGAEILRGPQDTEYGSREYSVRDPEGQVWSFGTYLPEG